MKPRYEEISTEAEALLKKASNLDVRLDILEKAKMCPCGSGKPQAKCCPDMKKASPDYIESFSTSPQDVTFVSETGGQTKSAGYSTNGHTLDVQDIANKGATSISYPLESLANRMNTHGIKGQDHLVSNDSKMPKLD